MTTVATIFGPELAERIARQDAELAREIAAAFRKPRPSLAPFDWACENQIGRAHV